MFFFFGRFAEGVGNKTNLLPTPFIASRRRRASPRHHNALSDRDLFDVGQRERVALAEALGNGSGDDATHRVCDLQQVARPTTCVKIKILRRVRTESSRRPARHRRDACSMAWRCRFLAARRSQDGHVIAEK